MKQRLWTYGVNPIVIPNGIPARLLQPVGGDPGAVRSSFDGRLLLVKVARFDPDKRWLQAIHAVAGLKRDGLRPLLIARGGLEPHGHQVFWAARAAGLTVVDVHLPGPVTAEEVWKAMADTARTAHADVLNIRFRIPEETLRLLYGAGDAVLANSGFEPFGLVGLEAMADRGIAFTGATGEDYARSYENAICIETDDAREIAAALSQLRNAPDLADHLRAEGRKTAETYIWPQVIRALARRIENLAYQQ